MAKLSKLSVTMATVFVLLVPGLAHAFGSYDYGDAAANTYRVMASIKSGAQSVLQRLALAQDTIINRLTEMEQSIIRAIKDDQNAEVSMIEKSLGGEKELTQAEITYEAMAETSEWAAESLEAGGTIETMNTMCDTAETTNQITKAATVATISAKSHAAELTRRNLNNTNSGSIQKDLLDEHNANYCSDADAALQRCTATSKDRQNADIRADSLLAPVNGSTYSEEEKSAAKQYIVMASNAVPIQALPAQLEKSAAGASFVLASRIAEAQMSIANFSLTSIYNGYAAAESGGSTSGISMMGLLKKNVMDRFANSDWRTSLEGEVSMQKLLIQIALLIADENYMDYHIFLQGQRTEAIMATDLAINSRQANEPILGALRTAAAR